MNDFPNWAVAIIAPVLSAGAAFAAAWIGVRIAIAQHSIQIADLRSDFDSFKAVFDRQNNERSGYIRQIEENQQRITELESLTDRLRREAHELRNEISPHWVHLQMACQKLGIPWDRK